MKKIFKLVISMLKDAIIFSLFVLDIRLIHFFIELDNLTKLGKYLVPFITMVLIIIGLDISTYLQKRIKEGFYE